MKRTTALALALAALTFAGSPAAASPLRVIASGHSSGAFAVTAASATANHVGAIYLRGYGHGLSGFAAVGCSRGIASIGSDSTTLHHMTSGLAHRLKQPFAGDCQITASLSGTGKIRLEIVR